MYRCRICSLTLKKEHRLKKSDIHTGFGGKHWRKETISKDYVWLEG